MNKMKHYFCITVGLALSLSACIKEDISECLNEIRVIFSYDEAGVIGTFPANELHSAILYVFDLDNRLVDFCEINNPQLNVVQDVRFKLDPGQYSFVVWFNPRPPYAVFPSTGNLFVGTTLKSEGQFSLTIPSIREIAPETTLPPLLYGQKDETIIDADENRVVIPVIENTNRININVKGLPATTDTYRFAIRDNNGAYTFDNDFMEGFPAFAYIANTTYSPTGTLSASLTVLKLAESRSPELTLVNWDTDEELFPGSPNVTNNLVEIIRAVYPGNDFSKRHVYDIDIEFREGGMEVWINVWEPGSSNVILTPWWF